MDTKEEIETIDPTQPIEIDVEDPTIDLEEEMDAERDALIEQAVKERVDFWLETHGAKLFALEFSKAAVKENKKLVKQLGPGKPGVPSRPPEAFSEIGSDNSNKRRRR